MTTAIAAVNPFSHANPVAAATNAGGNSDAAPSTISANDFLTLLVAEMKNQDPTAQTDPNQYINQLVQVNSLEQLIEINANLSSALTAPANGASATAPTKPASGGMAGIPDTAASAAGKGSSNPIPVSRHPIAAVSGNLGVPAANPAAQRVAQALSGHR